MQSQDETQAPVAEPATFENTDTGETAVANADAPYEFSHPRADVDADGNLVIRQVPEIDGGIPDYDAPAGMIQQIGETNYFVHTAENGHKTLRLSGSVGKTDAGSMVLVRGAQQACNEHNAPLGFPVIADTQLEMALFSQALQQRQMSIRGAPRYPVNHPFAIAERIKKKGIQVNSRTFRQLYRKELKKLGLPTK